MSKQNSKTKEDFSKLKNSDRDKIEKAAEEANKIVIPNGLYPMNNRIYTVEIETGVQKKGSLSIVPGKSDISSKRYFVAIADPAITYKVFDKDKDKVIEKRMKAGDVVRPFVLLDAEHYRPITDTINGVVYVIFERTEIAGIIPSEDSGHVFVNDNN